MSRQVFFSLGLALPVCNTSILAKIRLGVTHFFLLDHKEATESAYQDIHGGRQASPGLGRIGIKRRGVQVKQLNQLDLVGEGWWKKVVFWLMPGSWRGWDCWPLTKKEGRKGTSWTRPEAL